MSLRPVRSGLRGRPSRGRPDPKGLLAQVRSQAEQAPLAAEAVEAEDGRKLTSVSSRRRRLRALRRRIVAVPRGWPARRGRGDGSALVRLADNLNRRQPDGTWDNLFDAFRAVSCADFPGPSDHGRGPGDLLVDHGHRRGRPTTWRTPPAWNGRRRPRPCRWCPRPRPTCRSSSSAPRATRPRRTPTPRPWGPARERRRPHLGGRRAHRVPQDQLRERRGDPVPGRPRGSRGRHDLPGRRRGHRRPRRPARPTRWTATCCGARSKRASSRTAPRSTWPSASPARWPTS